MHSCYLRRLVDVPLGGRRVVVHLRARRFFCSNGSCVKKTFTEQIPNLTARHGQRSIASARMVQAVGLAVGGRPGSRLLRQLGAATDRTTVLRGVRTLPIPAASQIRVLGVDEFAIRRGRTYATLLVDVETHKPVDLLPERTADSLAAWLAAHPGVEMIRRPACPPAPVARVANFSMGRATFVVPQRSGLYSA
jgi:transposase